MTHVRQLPHIVVTWGLMFLTVAVGGVRPSCICADGALCVLCPKLMAAHAVSSATEPGASSRSCSAKSCCCEHAAAAPRSESTAAADSAGTPCDGCDCLAVQAAAPATVPKAEDPVSRLIGGVTPVAFATAELMLPCESFRPRGVTRRVGPPPDLIVLLQRWLV